MTTRLPFQVHILLFISWRHFVHNSFSPNESLMIRAFIKYFDHLARVLIPNLSLTYTSYFNRFGHLAEMSQWEPWSQVEFNVSPLYWLITCIFPLRTQLECCITCQTQIAMIYLNFERDKLLLNINDVRSRQFVVLNEIGNFDDLQNYY